jgi:WD40 repeat protein
MNTNQKSDNFEAIIISVNCELHGSVRNLVCGNEKCKESKLFCSTCALEDEQLCIKAKKHEALIFADFLRKYIKNEKNIFIDVEKLNGVINEVKKLNIEDLTASLIEYIKNINKMIENRMDNFYMKVNDKLNSFKISTVKQLDSLLDDYNSSDRRLDLTSFEIPENFGVKETKEFFEKNQTNKKEMENMISLIKKYLDQEKINTSVSDLETLIYSKVLGDFKSSNSDDKISKGGALFKSLFDELGRTLIPAKDSIVVFSLSDTPFKSNPDTLILHKEISQNCYRNYTPGAVCPFTNSLGQLILAYSNVSNQIDIYDLVSNSVIIQLSGHASQIYGIKYFFDLKTSNDYLVSTAYDRTIKIWSAKSTYTCLQSVPNAHTSYYLYSVLVFYDELSDVNSIVTCSPNEQMKVWDLNLNFLRSFGITNDYVYFTNIWYCPKTKQNYIITAGNTDFKIFEFTSGKNFRTFKGESSTWTMSGVIQYYEGVPHLIGADGLGWLRVWNIETSVMTKSISASGANIRGICLWNENYVCASSSDKTVKIYNLKDGTASASLTGHKDVVSYCGKVLHPKLGEILISAGVDAKIIIWAQKEQK